jgi:CMP-N-acetylneuraminic acid synthetase
MKRKIFVNMRLESQRVPHKVTQDINGITLFQFALQKMQSFDIWIDVHPQSLLDKVRLALPWANSYLRKNEHATAENPGTGMVARFLEEQVEDQDEPVAIYHLTSPFLVAESINAAFSALVPPYDSVATVNTIRNYVYRGQHVPGNAERLVPVNFDPRETPRTQDMEPLYMLNHACFVITKRVFNVTKSKVGLRPYFLELRFPENWDIDYPDELEVARFIAAKYTARA